METAVHVAEDPLERYAMDRATETESAAIEEHLLTCSACRDRLSDLDAYIRAIRAALQTASRPAAQRRGG